MRSFRKGIELFFIYLLVIVGIFVLQFRTDSNIIEKIKGLQVTLIKSDNDNSVTLQNKFSLSYNGLNFHSDDQQSARVRYKESRSFINTKLTDYSKTDSSLTLKFSDDISITFDVTGDSEDAPLSVHVNLPEDAEAFYLPYSFSYNMKITKEEGNKIFLAGKKSAWSFTTNQVQDGYVYFTRNDAMAYYQTYDDTKKFTFDSLTELALADEAEYKNTVNNIKNNLISSFRNTSDAASSELAVIAYVAAMSENGKYQQAIDEIPSSFKKSDSRTYLSSPYFNNLDKMNVSLDKVTADFEKKISESAESGSLEIFTSRNLASYLCIDPDREAVLSLLNNAVNADTDSCSLSIVTGIIQTYDELYELNKDLSAVLSPVIEKYISKIADNCSFDDNIFTISENDQFLSVLQASDIGLALMRYGEANGNQTYLKAGRFIINSYLSEASFDLKTLANLYPKFAYKNTYYPHIQLINPEPADIIWAWTCAKDITSERDAEDNLSLEIEFPLGEIHYVIFKGLPKFSTIYIYDLAFRTDPRFETYNSSGYVYKENGYTLLLKSRHKSKVETVRMVYSGLPSHKPAPKK